jgi:Flp pilus assembly protein TadG
MEEANNSIAKPKRRGRSLRKVHPSRRGTEILEVALLLPLLLGLTFGTIEYGYYWYINHSLQGAARAGARAGIPTAASDADVQLAVDGAMKSANLDKTGYTTAISADADNNLKVTVSCTWDKMGMPTAPLLFPTPHNGMQGVAVMRKE